MTTRRPARRSSRRPKKRTQWFQQSFAHAHGVGISIVATDMTPEPMQSSEEGVAKILRLILHAQLSSAVASSSVQRMALGVTVLGHEGFAQLAFPTPFTGDNQVGWHYWTSRFFRPHSTAPLPVLWDADIRTQRLLRGGYKLVLISENPAQDIATDLDVSLRSLWEID